MKILITGKNGYIGRSLHSYLCSKHDVTIIGRQDFDLADSFETIKFFSNKFFDVVIHTAVVGGHRDKQEDSFIIDQNLKMYYNLLDVKNKYTKFIHFGSGAEGHLNTPYGWSKNIICKSILDKPNFYNLRIFGVFDENELDTRFIKASIKHYINKEPILIYQDKYMDFIYMSDLTKIVEYYINNNGPKELNCNYSVCYSLENIANIINNLDNYKVDIKVIKDNWDEKYNGCFDDLSLNFKGLEQGIKEVYSKLK